MSSNVKHLDNGKVAISTKRLVLRGAQRGDAEYLNEPFSDPEVMRYWSEPPHKSMERTKEWISKMSVSQQNGTTDFIITLQPDDTPIGKIGVWQDEEIGLLISRQHWRKGLAQEAVNGIMPYLFDEKDFKQLTADIDPRNVASRGILESNGFEEYEFKEKTAYIGGEWVDSVYLTLTKEKWKEAEEKRSTSKQA